jgi:hypothetical protein
MTFIFLDNTTVTENNSEKIRSDSNIYPLNFNNEIPISSNVDDPIPPAQNQYEYYRNMLFERFNITYGDYLNMDEENTEKVHNYTIALWGKENGTLSEEEVFQLTQSNSPVAFGAFPNEDVIWENTDGKFRARFSITGQWGEMVRVVEAWLDDNSNKWVNGPKRMKMKIREIPGLWGITHGHVEDNGYKWVGKIELFDTAFFEIWCTPGYIDNEVEIQVRMKWYFYDVWDWFDPWKGPYYTWEYTDRTYYIKEWWLIIIPILGSNPIKIVDDDKKKPIVSCYIIDYEDLRDQGVPLPWPFTGDISFNGFYIDVYDPPTKIEADNIYKYNEGQTLFILSEDDSPPGKLIMDIYQVLDSTELYLNTIEVGLSRVYVWTTVYLWPFGDFPVMYEYRGFAINLTAFPPGYKYKLNVQVEDSDNDRGDIDKEISDPFEFILYTDAPPPEPEDIGVGMGAGTAQLVQNLDGVIPDEDFSHVDLQTHNEYEVFPYKKNTNPAKMTFDLQYFNPFDFPLRIKLNYTQFENSPRLSTNIDINQFEIVRNGIEGRENIYHGFGSGTTEEIENNNFNSFIPNNINIGGIGEGVLWFELKPQETKIFEDFLTIEVENLELLSYSDLNILMDDISLYVESANALSSIAFDFMTFGIFDWETQSDYYPDEVFNLFNALLLNEYLYSLKSVSNFGIKVDEVFYPKYYSVSDDLAIWNNTYSITDREILNLFLIADDEKTLGYDYNLQTGYNTFKFAFYPTDDQISAFTTFIYQTLLRDTLLYISSFASTLPDGTPEKELLEVFPMIAAVGISPLLYHMVEIMNGIDPLDYKYYEQSNPGLIQIPIDQFPELQQDNILATKTSSFLERSFEVERELQGFYESMNRYNTAILYDQWNFANDQLLYAAEFSANAGQIIKDMIFDLAFIMEAISDGISNLGMDPFSNNNIDMVRNTFEFDNRYLAAMTDQAIFRLDDENTYYLAQSAHFFIFSNSHSEIKELGSASLNSISFYSSAKYTFTNLEKSCVHEAVDIQIHRLNLPIINDATAQALINQLNFELYDAFLLFNSKLYQSCIETLEVYNGVVLDKYLETRNPEFSRLYYEGSRLLCLAQKWNQIDVEVFDYESKEVINGQNVEYIFQVHNDVNYGMILNKEIIVPEFNLTGLPEEISFKITYINSTEVSQNHEGVYYVVLGPEESILLKLVIEVPLNSPFELETYDFQMVLLGDFFEKAVTYSQDFTLTILEDDNTAPEISIIYVGELKDVNPGTLEFNVTELDYGSDATANLTIEGPNGFKYFETFNEGKFTLDLSSIDARKPGDYSVTFVAENNDEDRGDIDEEISIASLSFSIEDDDITAPEISLSHTGSSTDSEPGLLEFSIIEDGIGSEATGVLTITGPYDYLHVVDYIEGSFILDLSSINVYEPGTYTSTLNAENNDEDGWIGDEESGSTTITFTIVDDDSTAPELSLSHIGSSTDGDPGQLDYSIFEDDQGSDATGTLTIMGPYDFLHVIDCIEGNYILDLSSIGVRELGLYTVTLNAENNDEDGWIGDEESSSTSITVTIEDDDLDAPVITITLDEVYSWDLTGTLININFTIEAFDASGFNSIDINIGTYTSDSLGFHEVYLPEGIYDLLVTIRDNDNDRIREIDWLESTETIENIILDLTPPETNIIMDPHYDDDLGRYFVTYQTLFSFVATDNVAGVDYTVFKILGETVWTFAHSFTLQDYVDGNFTIEFYSVDNVGNTEEINSLTVTLVNPEISTYLSDEVDPISSFDIIFTKYKNEGYKLVATNPGQIFYNLEIINEWPISINTLTIDITLPFDFILKGTNPIHLFLNEIEITDSCTIDGTLITINELPPDSTLIIVVHMDYGLKGNIYQSLDDFIMRYYEINVDLVTSGGINTNPSKFLYGTYSNTLDLVAHQKKTTAIAGFLTDENGNPIAGALVELYYPDGSKYAEIEADENGFYYFVEIPHGDYDIFVNGILIIRLTTIFKELILVDIVIPDEPDP